VPHNFGAVWNQPVGRAMVTPWRVTGFAVAEGAEVVGGGVLVLVADGLAGVEQATRTAHDRVATALRATVERFDFTRVGRIGVPPRSRDAKLWASR
jgi:hypothetical protein